jgi:hypothetical protein
VSRMNTQRLASTYFDLTHGWHGFVILYLLISIFSWSAVKPVLLGTRTDSEDPGLKHQTVRVRS